MSPWVWLLICVAAIVVLYGLGLVQKQVTDEGFAIVDANTVRAQRQQLQFEGERRYNDLALLQAVDSSVSEDTMRASLQQIFPVPTSSQRGSSLLSTAPIDQYKAADDGSNKVGTTLEQTGILKKKVALCESISHLDCAKLNDPIYSECGVCHANGRNSSGGQHRGGLYISADDQIRANAIAKATGKPVEYTPTLGKCPTVNFTLREEACIAKRDTESCINQTPSMGNSCGKCIGTQNAFFMGPKPTAFDAILHVSHSGFYTNSMHLRHASSVPGSITEDVLLMNGQQKGGVSRPALNPFTVPLTLREGDTLQLGIYGIPQVWCAWLSSADGKRSVGINVGVEALYPTNGMVTLGDTQSVKVNAFFKNVPGWEAYKQTVPPTVLWYTRRNDIVPPAILQADAIIKIDDTTTTEDITSRIYYLAPISLSSKKISLGGVNRSVLPANTERVVVKLDNGTTKGSTTKDGEMSLSNVQASVVGMYVTVPATLAEPYYNIDSDLCPSGPIITTSVGVGKMDNNPCFDRKGAFKQTAECVQRLFISAGGTINGTLYPNTLEKAKAIIVDNDFSKTVDYLNNLGSIAMYGTDNNGAPSGFAKQKDAALQMLGVNMTNPCDGPPPYSTECLNYLWKTSGQTAPDRVDPATIDSIPYSYCTANGTAAPLKSDDNVSEANDYGTIPAIRQYYNSLFTRSQDDSDFDIQAAAMKQCYGVMLKAPELGKLTCPSKPETEQPKVMYGDWVGRDAPIQAIKKLNTGENVYLITDDGYVKMVTQSGAAKYFTGADVNLFNPNSWNSYSDAAGHYLLKPA